MRRWLHVVGLAALALLPLQGCSLSYFTIAIPDFESKAVQGVWLWRLSPTTGTYERDTQFVFVATEAVDGSELLTYSAVPGDGAPPVQISTYLTRDGQDPDRASLQLIYTRSSGTGSYRASSYNQLGDSPLTDEAIPM